MLYKLIAHDSPHKNKKDIKTLKQTSYIIKISTYGIFGAGIRT
jgi:hypothetical protein